MSTVNQTIDEVLHDMKAKYDAANQGKSTQMQQITSAKSAKLAVEQVRIATLLLDGFFYFIYFYLFLFLFIIIFLILQQAIAITATLLNQKCQQLKKICSGFNLVDELHAMLNQLETESRSLVSMDAR